MDEREQSRLASFLKLVQRHRGEPRGAYDEVASVYDSFVGVWDRHIAAPALDYFNQILARRTPPNATVLDAGAGTGERTTALLRYSHPSSAIALDASRGMLNVARSKIADPRVRFVLGDLPRLPFPDDTFDLVSCTWTIEIMDDPRSAVQELIRVVKPGGVVVYAFCSVPEGPVGHVLGQILSRVASKERALSHLLSEEERPFHRCSFSSLKQFVGGLTTVASVGKCCQVTDELLPCPRDAEPAVAATNDGDSGRRPATAIAGLN